MAAFEIKCQLARFCGAELLTLIVIFLVVLAQLCHEFQMMGTDFQIRTHKVCLFQTVTGKYVPIEMLTFVIIYFSCGTVQVTYSPVTRNIIT